MTAGVYAIVNTANGMAYIGSSENIERRWYGRRRDLDSGISVNKPLQAAWSASEGQGFELHILEETARDEAALETAEQRWLDRYQGRCYNVRVRVWRVRLGNKLPGLQPLRMAAKLSVRQLSIASGVQQHGIARIERGGGAQLPTILKLAAALHVRPTKLEEHASEIVVELSDQQRRSYGTKFGWQVRGQNRRQPAPPPAPGRPG